MALMMGEASIRRNTGTKLKKFTLEIVAKICPKSTNLDQIKIKTKPKRLLNKIFIIYPL